MEDLPPQDDPSNQFVPTSLMRGVSGSSWLGAAGQAIKLKQHPPFISCWFRALAQRGLQGELPPAQNRFLNNLEKQQLVKFRLSPFPLTSGMSRTSSRAHQYKHCSFCSSPGSAQFLNSAEVFLPQHPMGSTGESYSQPQLLHLWTVVFLELQVSISPYLRVWEAPHPVPAAPSLAHVVQRCSRVWGSSTFYYTIAVSLFCSTKRPSLSEQKEKCL